MVRRLVIWVKQKTRHLGKTEKLTMAAVPLRLDCRPLVLLVEDDHGIRGLIRAGLEVNGVEVIEAETLAQARVLLDEPFEAVVLDRRLPDGAGDSLVPELLDRLPPSRIIVHSSTGPLPDLASVDKGDFDAIAESLGLFFESDGPTSAVAAQRSIGRVHREWLDLCRWDPALAPDARPPIADSVIRAIAAALENPQPLGWGLDPAVEPVAEAFGLNVGDVPMALAELVCLREAFVRVVVTALEEDQLETARSVQMVIDRMMLVVAESGIRRLVEQALADSLTGLGNRRAFEQDLERERARATRHNRTVTIAILDVDGLKQVNDSEGHAAGDELLRRLARAIRVSARSEDGGYRIGGDEFALILPDAVVLEPDELVRRLRDAGAPSVSIGMASAPPDDSDDLAAVADERLYARRRAEDRSNAV